MTELSALYALFDHLSDGFCLADAEGSVLYMNDAARKLLEVSGPQRQLPNICQLLCGRLQTGDGSDARERCALRSPADPTQAVTYVGRHGPRTSFNWRDDRVHRADQFRDLRVRCLRSRLPLSGPQEEDVHVVLIEDASHEMELKRHRSDWRSMIAHDLRTPLASVYSALKLLQEAKPSDCAANKPSPSADVDMLALALRNCRRMIELLDLYLDVAQLDAGAAQVRIGDLELLELVEDAVAEQSALASEHGVTIEVEVAPDLKARADRELLGRVIDNLLNNAIKYNVKGGKIMIAGSKDAGSVRLSFKDTGRGIPELDLPRIFDRYFQAEARRAGRIKGNGLGLTFCKEAVALMKGEIGVASRVGEGSEFIIRLPAAGL